MQPERTDLGARSTEPGRQLLADMVLWLTLVLLFLALFDYWNFGLIYDNRRAILTTIWKSYSIVSLILLGSAAVAMSARAVNELCQIAVR